MKKVILVTVMSMLILSGCAGGRIENNLSQIRIAKGEELIHEKTNEKRAQDIKENIMKIEELEGAAVVVEGHMALIGLRVKEKWQKDIIRLKNEAEQLAKEADEGIDGTAVTTNEKITTMIERMERKESACMQSPYIFAAKFS